ncbi:MAG: PD-(D/E)XK nuclease family protein [Candidatus Brocadiales bacterium]|nr:PD-(D/E)XK nuclease family protein [Candidatus Bathyanammoxibius sp.]
MENLADRIALIRTEIAASKASPAIQESLLASLVEWVRLWPEPPGQAVGFETEFAFKQTDLRDRPFYLCGRRDYEGTDSKGLFLGEFKTRRGPWIRQSVDASLKDWWRAWDVSWQAAVYLRALTSVNDGSPPDTFVNRFLVRVAIKPGKFNSATVREKWFTYTPKMQADLWQSFLTQVTNAIDCYERNEWPMSGVHTSCLNRFRKLCPYWDFCTAKNGAARPITFPQSHLSMVGTLDPAIPWFDVSKISLFSECPRKFYYRYILGITEPEQDYLTEGKLFHQAVELLWGGGVA